MTAVPSRRPDLLVTALYTAGTWTWAAMPGADLLDHRDSRRAFTATNAMLAITGALRGRGRGPSVRHSLVQRHVIVDRVVEDSGAPAVLELGAGLSRRGIAMSADPGLRYTEVDRAPVIARKRVLLERSDAGRAALARENLRLIAGEIGQIDLAGFDAAPAGASLVVIAEGLVMYLDPPAQRRLFTEVAALLAGRGGTFVFDLFPRRESRSRDPGGKALGWTIRTFTGGAGFIGDDRSRDDIVADLAAAGFTVDLIEPRTAPQAWQVPHGDVATQVLVFVGRISPG